MKHLIPAFLMLAVGLMSACGGRERYANANTVNREYSKTADEASKAALQAAKAADLKIKSEQHDQFGGELIANRKDDTEIRIRVKSLTEKRSLVSVYVESEDLELANLIHERIAGTLGMGAATTGWRSGGSTLQATYASDLPSCMSSARRTITSLAKLAQEEVHETWGQIDGRLKESTPVRIRMERIEDRKTTVTFIVGTVKNEDNDVFARMMKEAFETTTKPLSVGGR